MGNETTDKIIVFTKADLSYICKQYFNPKTPKRLTCISQYIYIHGEHDGNRQRRSGSEAK